MTSADDTAAAAFQGAIANSEMLRQADMNVARTAFEVVGGWNANALDEAAMFRNADIAHFVRCVVAARATGQEAGPYIEGLRALGRDMYGN